jgi:hypothetical protein
MDGVAAVKQVLHADGTLTGLVPTARIIAGALPQGVTLPAIALESIAKVDRNILHPGSDRHVNERVQVTVLAKNYPSQKAIMRAVRHAAADTFPTVSGLANVTIHTDGAGPDLITDDASIRIGTQDFRVDYVETR